MSFRRSNNKMAISLLTLLTFLMVATNTYYYNKMSKTEEEVEKLKESEKIKKSEILNLESKIKTVDEKLAEKENEISNLKEKLNETENENQKLKNENEKLKKELEKYDSLRKLSIVATAYTSDCKGCIGITSTGYDVRKNKTYNGMKIIASDPNVIPMNSIVLIKTDNNSFKAISLDTGGAIKGNRIDILMDTKDDAYNFGRQNVEVIILE